MKPSGTIVLLAWQNRQHLESEMDHRFWTDLFVSSQDHFELSGGSVSRKKEEREEQVRSVSVKAERPNHPSCFHARQGGGGGGWGGPP